MQLRKLQYILLSLGLIAWAVIGQTGYAQSEAQVRFVHAFVDAPDVDIYVNDTITAEAVPFGAASDYLPVPAGDVEIAVTATGDITPLFTQTVTAGIAPLTLVVSNADGFVVYTDNVDPLNVGQARLTAIHAIDGAPAVDVVLVDGRPVIAGLEYAVPYGTLDVPAFNYGLNVVPSGSGLESAIFAETINAPLVTGTSYMAIVYGVLDAPQVMLLSEAVEPNPGDGFLQLTHNVEGAPAVDVYANDTLIAPSLAFDESTEAFPVAAGDYTVQVTAADTVDILVGSDLTVATGTTSVASVELDGETVVINVTSETPLTVVDAGTDTEAAAEVVPAPAQEVVVQPTAPPAPAQEVVPADGGLPTGRVLLDPGANLQLRQYPDSQALSLGLAPSGAVMTVNGREGVPVQIEGLFSQELQRQIDAYIDPAEGLPEDEDISATDTWLNVTYNTPDGGSITAWVLSQFVDVIDIEGETQRLADLPTIPANAFGEAINTEVTPPPVPEDVVVVEVYNLNPGASLQIRRTPDIFGESLGLLNSGTVLEYIGLEISPNERPGVEAAQNAEWIFIRYTPPEGGEVTGWVSTQYIQFRWRGELIDFDEMEARAFLFFEDPSVRGELGSGAVAPARPTVDPLADQVVADVQIDPGANLQFRRTPSANGESLGLIPSGSRLLVTARDESGAWLLVEFEGVTGWIASQFVRLTLNGEPYELSELFIEAN